MRDENGYRKDVTVVIQAGHFDLLLGHGNILL